LKILLVDDEKAVLKIMNVILRREGHELMTADNGKEGLELFREGKYDLIISDNTMPAMTGTEMVDVIKREKPDQRVIMVTGDERVNVPGANLVLAKPVSRGSLLEAIRKVGAGNK